MAAARRSLSAKESEFEDFAEGKVRNLAQQMKKKKIPDRLGKVLQASGAGLGDDLVKMISEDTAMSNSLSMSVSDLSQGQQGCSNAFDVSPKQLACDDTNSKKDCDLFKNQKIRSGMGLYQHIRHLKIQEIDLIEAVGVSLYKVSFLSVKAANNFVKNENIKAMKLNHSFRDLPLKHMV